MLTIRGGRIEYTIENGVMKITKSYATPVITINNNIPFGIDVGDCKHLTIYVNNDVDVKMGRNNTLSCGNNCKIIADFQCTIESLDNTTLELGDLNSCSIGKNSKVILTPPAKRLNIINSAGGCEIIGDTSKCVVLD